MIYSQTFSAHHGGSHLDHQHHVTLQEGTTASTLSPPAEKSKSPTTHPHHIYRGTIESVLTSCITVWYGNCSAADRKTLQRTVNTAAKIIGALSHPSWTFSLHDAPAKPTASWRTPPTPPTVSSSSYHQEDGTGASEPAPPDCSTAFSPRLWEPWTQITPPPPLKPYANPYLLKHGPPPLTKHPPTLPHQRKNCELFCAIQVCYTQVSGPVRTTCSNTLSSMH